MPIVRDSAAFKALVKKDPTLEKLINLGWSVIVPVNDEYAVALTTYWIN